MDVYKKQPLRFSNEHVRRAYRQAESLKARESSRFKRLSMIRSCNESNLGDESVTEAPAAISPVVSEIREENCEVGSAQKEKQSVHPRLEMLKKYKEEKMIKKEIEKQKKKPFYAGSKAPISLLKIPSVTKPFHNSTSSFIHHKSGNVSVSNMSRNIAPTKSSVLPPRIPYNFKAAVSAIPKLPISAKHGNIPVKKPAPVPTIKVTAPKSIYSVKRENLPVMKKPNLQSSISTNKGTASKSTSYVKKNTPADKKSSVQSSVSTNKAQALTKQSYGPNKAPLSKNLQTTVVKPIKANQNLPNKMPSQANTFKPAYGLNKTPSGKGIPSSIAAPPSNKNLVNKLSSIPKPGISRLQNRPVQKVHPLSQATNLNSVKTSMKPIVKVDPIAGSNHKMKKNQNKVTPIKEEKTTGKMTTPSVKEATDNISEKKIPAHGSESEDKKHNSGEKQESCNQESAPVSLKDLDNFEEIKKSESFRKPSDHPAVFSCDVSAISTSFAPHNFKFQPERFSSLFDDDIFESLEEAKREFFSRTSTPTKGKSRPSSLIFKPSNCDIIKHEEFIDELEDQSACNKIRCEIDSVSKVEKMSQNENILDLVSSDILINEVLDEIDFVTLDDSLEDKNRFLYTLSSVDVQEQNTPENAQNAKVKSESSLLIHVNKDINEAVQLNSEVEKSVGREHDPGEAKYNNTCDPPEQRLSKPADCLLDITYGEQDLLQNAGAREHQPDGGQNNTCDPSEQRLSKPADCLLDITYGEQDLLQNAGARAHQPDGGQNNTCDPSKQKLSKPADCLLDITYGEQDLLQNAGAREHQPDGGQNNTCDPSEQRLSKPANCLLDITYGEQDFVQKSVNINSTESVKSAEVKEHQPDEGQNNTCDPSEQILSKPPDCLLAVTYGEQDLVQNSVNSNSTESVKSAEVKEHQPDEGQNNTCDPSEQILSKPPDCLLAVTYGEQDLVQNSVNINSTESVKSAEVKEHQLDEGQNNTCDPSEQILSKPPDCLLAVTYGEQDLVQNSVNSNSTESVKIAEVKEHQPDEEKIKTCDSPEQRLSKPADCLLDIAHSEQDLLQNTTNINLSESLKNTEVLEKDESVDSTDIFDINAMKRLIEKEMQRIQDIDKNTDCISDPENIAGRKSTGVIAKRVSILKSVSVLNSISEACDEANVSTFKTPKKKSRESLMFTPRRSTRLSSSTKVSKETKPIPKENACTSVSFTPRRSLRLRKSVSKDPVPETEDSSSSYQVTPRRSMRLISLNTPESARKLAPEKSDLTAEFKKLAINSCETKNQSELLLDFEDSPGPVLRSNSKKVSLLYSPNRRMSVRKSIKGDLMSFSPSAS